MRPEGAPQTTSEFLDVLGDFLADSSGQTLDEVENELRVEGIDPELLATNIRQLVDRTLDDYRLRWQVEARERRAEVADRTRDTAADLPSGKQALTQAISEIFGSAWGRENQLAHAYRKWEELTEEDLRSLLTDLIRLRDATENDISDQ